MKNKYLIQIIAYLLLGFVAMANPGDRTQPQGQAIEYSLYDTAAMLDIHAVDHHVQAFFHSNLPAKRQAKIKSRFRAVSFYQIIPIDITRLDESIYPATVSKLGCRINSTHLPPLYYLFLFRLTPF